MRKVFHLALIAAATLSLAACQKEIESPVATTKGNEIQLNFSSVKPNLTDVETKTAWTGETITWSKGDAIRIAYTVNGTWQAAAGAPESGKPAKMYASDALTEDAEIASFKVSTHFTDEANLGQSNLVYKFYGIYPSAAGATDFTNAPSLNITIPAEQTPKANSFDGALDIMYATSADYDGIPSDRNVDLNWHRIVSHADISMRNLQLGAGETLESITVTAQSGADLVGSHTLNITNGEVALGGATAGNSITVKADNLTLSDGAVEFWFTSLPFSATELTFTARTDKYSYVRTFTGLDLQFLGNARNTLSVNMKKAIKLVNYEESFSEGVGDFTADAAWSHGTYSGTSYMKAQSTDAASGAWLVSPKLSILTNQSTLSFSQSINKFFGAIENEATVWARVVGGEWTKINITYPDKPSSGWSSFEETTASLSAYEGKTIQIGFKYVGTTESYGGWEISNFKVTNASAIYDPVFTITSATTKEVSFTASTVEFTYSAAHLTSNPTVAIKAGSDDIIDGTPTIADGKITVNVKANDDTENTKQATLVVTCEGVDNIPELVINQAKKENLVETEATIDFSKQGYSNEQQVSSLTQDPFTVTFTNGGTNTAYYNTGSAVRVYNGGTMTVSSEYTITKIEIAGNAQKGATLSADGLSGTTWTGSSNSVTISVGTAGHYRFQALTITYLSPGSDIPATYSLNIASGIQNGSVTASKTTNITENESVTLTISPDSGYELETLTVDNENVTSSVVNDKYTFSMPSHNVEVSATFKSSGSVTPGEDKTATIKSTWTGSNEQDLTSLTETDEDITALFQKNNAQNGIYHSTSQIRVYQGNTITLSGGTINKVEITCSASSYNKGFTTTIGNSSSSEAVWTWEGSSTNLVITSSGSSRILKIDVTYK